METRQVQFEICCFCGTHGDFILRTEPLFFPEKRGPIYSYTNGVECLQILVEIKFFTTTEAAYLQHELERADMPNKTEDLSTENLLLIQQRLQYFTSGISTPPCHRMLLN